MILLHHEYGQLANRMIVIIHFTGYCLQSNRSLSVLNFDQYSSNFDQEALNNLKRKGIKFRTKNKFWKGIIALSYRFSNMLPGIKVVNIRKSNDFEKTTYDLKQLPESLLTIPEGWLFRNFDAVQQYQNEIKSLFQPNKTTVDEIETLFSRISGDSIKIGIHIRRGDYKEFESGKYFYSFETYFQVLKELTEQLKDKQHHFFIFSNEPIPDYFVSESTTCSTNSFMADFFALNKCDYIVGPPSTFSLVSAYLGNAKLLHLKSEDSVNSIDIKDFKNAML